MKKQPYIAAVQYKHGIEIYREFLTLDQVRALRRYFFQQQIAGQIGQYTVVPDDSINPLPHEALNVVIKGGPNHLVTVLEPSWEPVAA